MRKIKFQKYFSIAVGVIIIIISLSIAIFPVIWMTFISFEPAVVTAKFPPPINREAFSVSNYKDIILSTMNKDLSTAEKGLGHMANLPILRSLVNSFIVATSATAIVIFLGLNGAYAFHRFNFWGKNIFFTGIIIGRIFPIIAFLVPFYILFGQLHMLNKVISLIFAHVVIFLPLFIWFTRGYMQGIPQSIIDSGKVDGASEIRILWAIVAPVCMPAISGMGILIFIFSWGEFFFASALLWSADVITMPIVLKAALATVSGSSFYWSGIMTLGVIGAIVPLIIGIVFQKQIISGLTAGMGKF